MVGQELSEPNACGESVRLHIIGYLAIFVEARSSVTCSRVVHLKRLLFNFAKVKLKKLILIKTITHYFKYK